MSAPQRCLQQGKMPTIITIHNAIDNQESKLSFITALMEKSGDGVLSFVIFVFRIQTPEEGFYFCIMLIAKGRSDSYRDGRAFLVLRSRVPGIIGTRSRGNANFIQDRGNAERKRIGTLNLRSCKELTGHRPPLPRAAHILYVYTR